MKPNIHRVISTILSLFCGTALTSCVGGQSSETTAQRMMITNASKESQINEHGSPEQQLLLKRIAYLETVTYRSFILTGEESPFYVGRWFEKEIDGIPHKVTLTDGAHLYFLIENANFFDVVFTAQTTMAEPYFAYSIDGGKPVRQHISEPTVVLPDTGRHTVCLIADGMTENEGKWDLEKGFAIMAITPSFGGSIVGIRPTEKVIFFYGDSITEGVRALGMSANSDGNSATNAYSWQCAETLGVTPYLIGYGASGIIMPGSFNTMLNAIDYLSEGRPVLDDVVPDVIIVNHGTNDGRQDSIFFEEGLTTTLLRLREKYPDTPIVYLIPFNQAHAQTITSVVKKLENAYVIETNEWTVYYTDGVHPNAMGAMMAGRKLAERLKDIFGYDFFALKKNT